MKIPFTDINVTPKEQLGVAAIAVAGWTSFCMAFSSAPALFTLAAIPATTALAVGVVKGVKAAGRFVTEKLEDYAENNPGSFVDNYLVPAFQPTFGPDEQEDHVMNFDKADAITAAERKGLYADFNQTQGLTFMQRTLTNLRERTGQYNVAPMDRREIDAIPERTTRSGNRF